MIGVTIRLNVGNPTSDKDVDKTYVDECHVSSSE